MSDEKQTLDRGRRIAESMGLRRSFKFNTENAKCALDGDYFYSSDDIHRLLSAGVEVFGRHRDGSDNGWTEREQLPTETQQWSTRDHKALLIAIRPLVAESEERKLIREIIAFRECDSYGKYICAVGEWVARARELLARGGNNAT